MRWLSLIAVLAACGPDDGDPIEGCHECGAGAIRAGRFIATEDGRNVSGLAANRGGDLARMVDGELEWLTADFAVADTQTFGPAPNTYDPEVAGIWLNADRTAFVSIHSDTDFDYATSIVALDPDHSERWRLELGSLTDYEDYRLDGDRDLAVFTGQRLDVGDDFAVTTGDVVALDGGDHSVRWRRRFPQPDQYQQLLIGVAPDGGAVVVAGSFNNTLDLGGSVGELEAVGSFDAFVAGLDRATGEALWATQFSVDRFVVAKVNHLAIGAAGDVAINVGWETSIDHDSGTAAGALTVGDQMIPPQPALSRAIALLGPTGEPRWIQQSEDLASLVTDGSHVFGGARGVISGLSATGVDWRRALTGAGYHFAALSALAGDRLVGSLTSFADGDALSPLVDGDVAIPGAGVTYVEIAH